MIKYIFINCGKCWIRGMSTGRVEIMKINEVEEKEGWDVGRALFAPTPATNFIHYVLLFLYPFLSNNCRFNDYFIPMYFHILFLVNLSKIDVV